MKEIVGDEMNPLRKALLVFRWVSKEIRWCSEMEYSTIANRSAKGIAPHDNIVDYEIGLRVFNASKPAKIPCHAFPCHYVWQGNRAAEL